MTTANGKATLKISENKFTLFSNTYNLTMNDFRNTEVGQGAFKRNVILCSFGRIPYSKFSRKPSESTGNITIEFETSSGKKLSGEDTVFW